MRTCLLRVHGLAWRALFFLGAWASALHASAQVRCEVRSDEALAPQYHRVLVTAQVGGDLLRYDTPERTCELRLDGRISAWAVSAPGQPTVIAVATVVPAALVFLDTNLRELQRLQLKDRSGRQRSPICALLVASQRQSFVAVFSDMAELWELSYNPLAAEIGLGMVHDFQYREGHFVAGYLNPLRTALPWNAVGAGLDAEGHMVQLRNSAAAQEGDTLVIHLDVRKPVVETVQLQGAWQACEKSSLLQKK